MAQVYGVQRTLKRTGTANTIEPELMGGVVKSLIEVYEASSLAADSIILLFGQDLPAEARIIDWIIDTDALDCSGLTFGTLTDKAVFMAAKDHTSATKSNYQNDGVADSLAHEIVAGSGATLVLHTTGATSAGGTITVVVTYVTKG